MEAAWFSGVGLRDDHPGMCYARELSKPALLLREQLGNQLGVQRARHVENSHSKVAST